MSKALKALCDRVLPASSGEFKEKPATDRRRLARDADIIDDWHPVAGAPPLASDLRAGSLDTFPAEDF